MSEKQWKVWVLCDGDIDGIAKEMGIKPSKLSEEDRETIARHFTKMVESVLGDSEYGWMEMLKDCIKGVMGG